MRRSIFLAYAWDNLTKRVYENISNNLKEDWDIRSGSVSQTLPQLHGKIEQFKNQNLQLFEIFVKNIKSSDVFIADVTTQNPNVMLELGVAINLNKNILILSGIPASKLPFDISGINIEFYASPEEIEIKIVQYLSIYKKIKDSTFENKTEGIYYILEQGKIEALKELIDKGENGGSVFRITPIPLELEKIKDIKIRVKYRIIHYHQDSDWFGFFFRSVENTGRFEPVNQGGILVNARVNGSTDITLYPGQTIVKQHHTHIPHDKQAYRLLEIMLENTRLTIKGDDGEISYSSLQNVNFGYTYLTCYRCQVDYQDLEIVNIDTVSEIISS